MVRLLLLSALASSAVAEGGCSRSGWVRSECRPSLSRHQLRRSLSSARDCGARSLGARSLGARSSGGGSTRRDDAPLRDPASREAASPLTRLAPLLRLRGRRQSASGAPLPPLHAGAMRLRGGSGAVSLDGASPMVKTCAFFASLDALLLGYDIGVVSGILLFIQDRFSLSLLETGNFAAALNGAAIIGALVSGWVADRHGRKPALFISSLTFTAGSIWMAAANSYRALLLGRYLQGYGVGAGLLISPMFISEIAPPKFRGSLVTLSEVSLSLGVLLAYVANYCLSSLPNQWRWMLGLGAAPGVLLTLRILLLPESPRFLVSKGRTEEAKAVLRTVMSPQPESAVSKTLSTIQKRSSEERGSSWRLLLQPATVFAVLVGCVLAAMQHAVGIESIIYHSPIIFEKAGIRSKRSAILGTVGMGLIKLGFESYALLNVDSIGRRPLLLTGAAGLSLTLFSLGALLKAKVASGILGVTPATWGILALVGVYSALHAISFGPVTWLVLSEIFPAKVKGKAMGLATTVNRCVSFVAALTFLSMCEAFQWGGTFYVYGAFALFSLLFFALFVPETTALPLEEIAPLFAQPRRLVRRNLASLRGCASVGK